MAVQLVAPEVEVASGGAGGSTSAGTANPGAGGIGRNAGTAGISKIGGAEHGTNTGRRTMEI